MTKYERIPAKVFAENASPVGENPEIGKFGNALQGIYTGEADVREIQNSDAWLQGWTSAVVSAMNYPPLPEMNGVLKVLSYQIAYLLQSGIAEWNSETTYYEYNAVNYKGKFYYSTINNNTTEPETVEGSANWELIETPTATSNSKGIVQPDGTTIEVNGNGVISAITATNEIKGISQPDNNTISIDNGTLSISNDVMQTIEAKTDLAQATTSSMPSTKYTDIELGASGTIYTAPADGWYGTQFKSGANFQYIYFYNYAFTNAIVAPGANAWFGMSIPVSKGGKMFMTYNFNSDLEFFRFIYANGGK